MENKENKHVVTYLTEEQHAIIVCDNILSELNEFDAVSVADYLHMKYNRRVEENETCDDDEESPY